jgi:hypothetical protein
VLILVEEEKDYTGGGILSGFPGGKNYFVNLSLSLFSTSPMLLLVLFDLYPPLSPFFTYHPFFETMVSLL